MVGAGAGAPCCEGMVAGWTVPVTGGYSSTRYVASFIGFAPAQNPRLEVAVMVDEPQGQIYGGLVAAPAFEKIVSFALPYLKIPPG